MSSESPLQLAQAHSSSHSYHDSHAKFIKLCIQFSSIALVYYDYILTLRLEINYVWRSRFRASTLLYILSRYALIANVLYLLAITDRLSKTYDSHNYTSCDTWYRVIGVLSTLGRASVIFVFTTRTYFLWNKNRWVLAWLGILGIGCVTLDCLHVPGLKCHGSSSSPMYNATLLSVLVCLLELSVAVLTVWSARRSFQSKPLQSQNLTGFVLQQGVLYFCGVFAFTFGAMILNFAVKPDNFLNKVLNAVTLPLSCILTARFLLHLRRFLTVGPEESKSQPSTVISGLAFADAGIGEFAGTNTGSPTFEGGDDEEEDCEPSDSREPELTNHETQSDNVASSSRRTADEIV